jgi:hypothetical protein
VALALALVVPAGLVVRSVARLNAVDLGFDTRHVVAAQLKLPESQYGDAARRLAFFEEVERRLAARPGIEAVAFANRLPLRGGWTTGLYTERMTPGPRGEGGLEADAQAVSPGYFRALGIPVLRGRPLAAADREGAPYVAVVNEEYARRFHAGEDPIGRRFRRGPHSPWIEVVGVAASLPSRSRWWASTVWPRTRSRSARPSWASASRSAPAAAECCGW